MYRFKTKRKGLVSYTHYTDNTIQIHFKLDDIPIAIIEGNTIQVNSADRTEHTKACLNDIIPSLKYIIYSRDGTWFIENRHNDGVIKFIDDMILEFKDDQLYYNQRII